MEIWETVALAMTGSLTSFAVLGWLSKSLVSQLLTKDVEVFKAKLKSESEEASQKLRHDLEKATIEHQVRFSKLHEKRAEVIAELYSLLVQAYWDISNFVSPMQSSGEPSQYEKYATAMNAVADFYRFFDKRKIYLPEKSCAQVDEFVREMRNKAIGFGVYAKYEDEQLPAGSIKEKLDAWTEAWGYLEKKVPEAKSALENELRSILGGIS